MATTAEFLTSLSSRPYEFLQPTLPLYTDAVAYLKHILDPVAKDVSARQEERLKDSRKKRKRRGEDRDEEEVLRLKQIHTDGFGVEQVWEQARRVIDAAREEAEREYAEWVNPTVRNGQKAKAKELELADQSLLEINDLSNEDLGLEGQDYEVVGVDDGEELYEGSDVTAEDEKDQVLEDDDEDEDFDMDGHDDFDDMEEDDVGEEQPAEEFVSDKFGLNDGFFSIDDFNRQSEFLEQRDARGEDDGEASDEEGIDWTADPTQSAAPMDAQGDAEDDREEEDGPTFGDPDAESDDEDEEVEDGDLDMGGMANTNDIMYKDFFAPPAQKKSKKQKEKNKDYIPKSAALKSQPADDREDDMQRTMEAVHRDLFDDEESEAEPDEHDEQIDPADPKSRRSAHERRKAAIAEEIRKLEAANVAKRDWQLSGEARAADRPVNSLLEEDLDFERAGKPVPVVTAEVSESLEELIKRRILSHDFQDIPRRRPDDLATGGKRGRLDFELDDQKSKKGLAEEYEEEYSKRTDPNYIDIKDEKLQKEQKEIETLWKEISSQLDSLSSWNFRPKQAAPSMDIRVDAPTITLEDARPNAGGDVAASQLAPQEVYKAGEASNRKEEIVGKSGLPKAREEMDRDERKRKRRRDKERIRKAGTNEGAKLVDDGKAKTKKDGIFGELKKGGVKVIGKKGALTDVEGRSMGGKGSGQGAGQYML